MHLITWHKQGKQHVLLRYITLFIFIILCFYFGKSILETGKIRGRALTLFLPLVFLWILNLADTGRFRFLIIAILLAPLQIQKIPFLISVSELLLFILAFLQIPVFQLKRQKNHASKVNYLVLAPYVLFAFAGFITGIIYGGLHIWHVFCVIPLLWMYVAMNMVRNLEDAFKLISAAVIGVLLFLCIYQMANFAGYVVHDGTMGWRMGTQRIEMGPIFHQLYSTTFATIIALGFVAANMMAIQKRNSMILCFLYMFIALIFAWALISSGARGGNVAAVAGTLLMLTLLSINGKILKRASIKYLYLYLTFIMIVFLFVYCFKGGMSGNFSNQLARFDVLFKGNVTSFSNFKMRMLYLEYAINDVMHNFFGNGFQYMWSKYRYDDCIVYVYLLEGTGILGAICFAFIVVQMFIHFLRNFIGKQLENHQMLASLGIGALACGLLAGVASEALMVYPMISFIFWTILASCFAGTQNKLGISGNGG